MRNLLVIAITAALCLVSPLRPVVGIYGYFWFALMRPDVLAWSGPNNYSFVIAVFAIFSNLSAAVRNLTVLIRNSFCRNLILLVAVITLSVAAAVDPSLCIEPYKLFMKAIIMAFLIPLAITRLEEVRWLLVVLAASIGLLGGKYGLAGIIAGGAQYAAGYGGMLSDNNTMALAFAMAVPLCWFARLLVPWRFVRLGFVAASICSMAAVVFTHSRGGVLAVGAALLLITISSKRKILAGVILVTAAAGISYLVWGSFAKRMATLGDATAEESAKSRIVLAEAALRLWKDYPLLGVGFTESNERQLIFKYVPPEYSVVYAGKVIHNTYAQMLVDSGIFALLLYLWLLGSASLRCWLDGHRLAASDGYGAAAIPYGLAITLATYAVGSTFLSRTSFDLFYILVMTAAAWFEVRGRSAAERPVPAAVSGLPAQPLEAPPVPAQMATQRVGFTRFRRPRETRQE